MTESLKKFFDTIGVQDDLRANLLAEEPAEDFDLDVSLETFNNAQQAVWKKKLQSSFSSDFDAKFTVNKLKLAKQIAKAAGLEKSTREIEELGFDGVVKLVPDFIKNQVTAASKHTDDELRGKLETWKTQAVTYKEEKESLEASMEEKINGIKTQADSEILNFRLGGVFNNQFKKIDYGVPVEHRELFEEKARKEIQQKWKIDAEGNITDQDGGKAVNFEGNGVYTHISEPIAYLASKYNVIKKSNAGRGGAGGGSIGGTTTDKMSSHAQAMLENMQKARK